MRCFVIFFILLIALFVSCVDGERDKCDVVMTDRNVPIDSVKLYKIVVSKDVPTDRVGLILDAAFEWVTASSGAVAFEVTYDDFQYKGDNRPIPPLGEIWIYTETNVDKTSSTVGVCWTWNADSSGRPGRSRIWIQDDLAPRMYYLTAMHEIGHALGLAHYASKDTPTIMYPYITDVGDHPTCLDRKRLCDIWGCAPGC